jgi:4-amino-4-deoxy-L-arabinose transferase-like glycosyltransferase
MFIKVIALVLFLFISGLTISRYVSSGEENVSAYYVICFAVQVPISIILNIAIIKIQGVGFLENTDVYGFYRTARSMSSGMYHPNMYVGSSGIYYIYYFVFKTLGVSSIYLAICWSYLSSVGIIPFYALVKKTFNANIAKTAAYLYVFCPSFIVMSAVPHKDILCTVIIIILFYCFSNLYENTLSETACMFLCLTLLALIRIEVFGICILVIFAYVMTVIFRDKSYIKKRSAVYVLIACISVITVLSLSLEGYRSEIYGLLSPTVISRRITEAHMHASKQLSGSGFVDSVVQGSAVTRLLFGPIILFVKPFPPTKTLSSFSLDALLTPDAWFIYSLSPFVLIGIFSLNSYEARNISPLVFASILIVVASSLLYGGAQIRYRLQVMPLYTILSAVGISRYAKYRPLLLIYICTFVSFIFIYYIIG